MESPLRRPITALLLLATVCAAVPAHARDDRLDPEERQRLRGELRRHAWEDRARAREAWRSTHPDGAVAGPGYRGPAPGYGGPPAGYPGTPPGYATPPPQAYGEPPSAYGGPPPAYGGPRPGYGGPPAGYAGTPPGYGAPGYGGGPGYGFGPGLPRLSPEERQALRHQLREARRHAVGDHPDNR